MATRDDTVSETRLLLLQEFKKLESITKQLANFLSIKLERLKYKSLESKREEETRVEKISTLPIDTVRLQQPKRVKPAKPSFLEKTYNMIKPIIPVAAVGAATGYGPELARFAGAATRAIGETFFPSLFPQPTSRPGEVQPSAPSKPASLFEKISQPFKDIFQPMKEVKPVGMTGSASEALDFFTSKGWSPEQAAGIVGNLQTESNLRTDALGDGGEAYGIAQWHPDRQQNFKQWSGGKDIRQSNFKEQLEFVHYELTQGKETPAGKLLRQVSTPEEAAYIVDKFYERSSGEARSQRIANAIALFNAPKNVTAPFETGRRVAETTSPSPKGSTTNIFTQQVLNTDSGGNNPATITTIMPSPESVRNEYLRI